MSRCSVSFSCGTTQRPAQPRAPCAARPQDGGLRMNTRLLQGHALVQRHHHVSGVVGLPKRNTLTSGDGRTAPAAAPVPRRTRPARPGMSADRQKRAPTAAAPCTRGQCRRHVFLDGDMAVAANGRTPCRPCQSLHAQHKARISNSPGARRQGVEMIDADSGAAATKGLSSIRRGQRRNAAVRHNLALPGAATIGPCSVIATPSMQATMPTCSNTVLVSQFCNI